MELWELRNCQECYEHWLIQDPFSVDCLASRIHISDVHLQTRLFYVNLSKVCCVKKKSSSEMFSHLLAFKPTLDWINLDRKKEPCVLTFGSWACVLPACPDVVSCRHNYSVQCLSATQSAFKMPSPQHLLLIALHMFNSSSCVSPITWRLWMTSYHTESPQGSYRNQGTE